MLIRIEGCNFGATLFDTDDLSTIRGSSLAYLHIAASWPLLLAAAGLPGVALVVLGASDGIYRVETAHPAKAVEALIAKAIAAPPASPPPALDAVRAHLTFTFAAVDETADYAADVRRLLARCRARQWQQPTLDIPEPVVTSATCPYDRRRPAATVHERQDASEVAVSASVDARRRYGRTARSAFYESEIGRDPWHGFADSFHDLVERSHQLLKHLPPALEGKMAVIYLDGNKFTPIRERVVFRSGAVVSEVRQRHGAFATALRNARRAMLNELLADLLHDGAMLYSPQQPQRREDARDRLKLETLLWGGDEALLVLPAWKLVDALGVLMSVLEADVWRFADTRLSHAVGALVCNIKTPIAVARALAEALANAAKPLAGSDDRQLANVMSLQILESVEPPRASLADWRKELYGTKAPDAFAWRGAAQFNAAVALIRGIKAEDGGLPRSQLFNVIRTARNSQPPKGAGAAAGAARPVWQELAKACVRSRCAMFGFERDAKGAVSQPDRTTRERLALLGAVPDAADAPLLPLYRLAELWDYVDPLKATSGRMTADAGAV